jgi:hypothetical protein
MRAMGGTSRIECVRVSRLRRLHTIFDAAASRIGGIAERTRGGERDGVPSVMRRTSRRVGMSVGRVRRCASNCGVHGAGFGLECMAALRHTKRCVCMLPSAVDGVVEHMTITRSAMRQCAPPTCVEEGGL